MSAIASFPRLATKLGKAAYAELGRWMQDNVVAGNGIAIGRVGGRNTIGLDYFNLPPSNIYGAGIVRVQVTAIGEDYMECVHYDSINGGTGAAVNVAKPYLLQKAPFHAVQVSYPIAGGTQDITYTYDATYPEWKRLADDGADSETQVITPAYWTETAPPCLLHAVWWNMGQDDSSGNRIRFQDINSDARVWAQE